MKEKALVSGFARSFISGEPIPDATISVLENESLNYTTDAEGKFGPLEWPIGQPITLVFDKPGSFWTGYRTTQTATIIVPPEGINNPDYLKNISFQVPSNMAFELLVFAMGLALGGEEDPEKCQIAATITPPNITMDDIPQGVEGVTATLSPDSEAKTFYFDIFPGIDKTNPFTGTLQATSLDGGVAFLNVPPGDYTIEAQKDGMTFSKISVKARKGVVVNASPPYGPVMQTETTPKSEQPSSFLNDFNFFKSEPLEAALSTITNFGEIIGIKPYDQS